MLGNRALKNSIIELNAETLEQYDIVKNEVAKLVGVSKMSWDLVSSRLFDKTRWVCFGEGIIFSIVVFGGAYAINKMVVTHKNDQNKD